MKKEHIMKEIEEMQREIEEKKVAVYQIEGYINAIIVSKKRMEYLLSKFNPES